VKCELRIISGGRAGHRDVFDKSYIGIGRHPVSDLRFDAEKDIDASTRHAAILQSGDSYVLRDLGSTNGTFVNGERLAGDQPLHDGDTLQFGRNGPEVTFRVLREEGEVVMAAVQAPRRTAPEAPSAPKRPPTRADSTPERTAPMPRGPSKTAVLRAEVAETRSRLRALLITLGIVAVGAVAVVVWQGRRSQQQVLAVAGQRDTALAEVARLRALQAQTDSTRRQLEAQLSTERDSSRRAVIQNALGFVQRRAAALHQAQSVDYSAIRAANDRAVAALYVRFADTTQMWTGTAFCVSADGRLITNKHIVLSNTGETPRDIAVQFSGTRDILPARFVRAADDADVALLQLESRGPFPVVAGLDASGEGAAEGAPIALIGFPGGADGRSIANAKLVTGSVTHVIADSLLELDAFSGTGASGSPIFGRDGRVVGVLFGGRGGASSTEIVGLPIRRAMGLIGH
jgi:pSer/pThr/pTyr-binding forkhead associated (FHA) protein